MKVISEISLRDFKFWSGGEDRDFLVDWFFETFGTWGISYNFQSNISEFLYMEFKNQQS